MYWNSYAVNPVIYLTFWWLSVAITDQVQLSLNLKFEMINVS